jgi:hypothetical protein
MIKSIVDCIHYGNAEEMPPPELVDLSIICSMIDVSIFEYSFVFRCVGLPIWVWCGLGVSLGGFSAYSDEMTLPSI